MIYQHHSLNQADLTFEEYKHMKESNVALTERMRVIMEVKQQDDIATKAQQDIQGEQKANAPASEQQTAQSTNVAPYWIEFLKFWDEEKNVLLIPGANGACVEVVVDFSIHGRAMPLVDPVDHSMSMLPS